MSLLKNMPMPTPSLVAKERRFDRVMAQHKLRQRLAKLRGEDKPVSPLDTQLRQQISTQPAEYHQRLHWLADCWLANNARFFGGKLTLPIFVAGQMVNKDALAECSFQTPTVIRFPKNVLSLKTDEELLAYMTHEMIHQCLFERGGKALAWDEPTNGHHQPFADVANLIAKQLKLPDVFVQAQEWWRCAKHWPPRDKMTSIVTK